MSIGSFMKDATATAAHPGGEGGLLTGARNDVAKTSRKLAQKWGLILAIVGLITALSIVVSSNLAPRYKATAKILIDPKSSRVLSEAPALLPALVLDRESIESEMQVLTSRRLAMQVVSNLNLENVHYFNPESSSGFDPIGSLRQWLRSLLGSFKPATEDLDAGAVTRAKVVDALQEKVDVYREGQSRVVGIDVESDSPTRSAEIANTIIELYLTDQLSNKFAQRKRITDWLEERLKALKESAATSEMAADEFRRKAGLFETKNEFGRPDRIDTQQLAKLSLALVDARAERATAEGRLRSLERGGGSTVSSESINEVISSPVISTLRGQEVRVRQRLADLETEFGPRHPEIIAAKAELKGVQDHIRLEIGRIVESLRRDVNRAQVREGELARAVDQLKADTADQNAKQIRLNAMVREADANQKILEEFLSRAKETSAVQALSEPDARVISYAEPPILPSFPKKFQIVALSFLGSLAAACGLVLLLDSLKRGFRTEEEVEHALGLRVIAVVPQIPRRDKEATSQSLLEYLDKHPTPGFNEAILGLRNALLTSGEGKPPRSLLFTSSLPHEGKSTIASSFARFIAEHGARVILVATDFRRPSIGHILGLKEGKGLTDYLAGQAGLTDILKRDQRSSLTVITSGSRRSSDHGLVDQGRMKELIDTLSAQYDTIILDSAPALVVTDAIALCSLVEQTLIVTRWDNTWQEDVIKTVRKLRQARACVTGIVLNNVNISRYAMYAYGNSKAYLQGYTRYYS
jgi:exopolysaccharide transport family protein